VFTPKHPRTGPVLDKVIEAEKALDTEALMQRAIEGIRRVKIGVER
jgi:thiamine biosynthesis protein ThiI